LDTPEAFDKAAQYVRPDDVRGKVLVSSDLEQHVAWLSELAALGFDEIALHHVGQDLDPFIDAFGEHVLPMLRAR
jgi:alkanesulfonate monooxygenase SsuD/methylene tetrahydromethanopterin reductase-like flavin-dependent oxidoreductase (luciferase family)